VDSSQYSGMSRLVQPWLAKNLAATLEAATDDAEPKALPQTDQGKPPMTCEAGYTQ